MLLALALPNGQHDAARGAKCSPRAATHQCL